MTNQTITFTVTINLDCHGQHSDAVVRSLAAALEDALESFDGTSEIDSYRVKRLLTEQDEAQLRLERRQAFRAARRNRQN